MPLSTIPDVSTVVAVVHMHLVDIECADLHMKLAVTKRTAGVKIL